MIRVRGIVPYLVAASVLLITNTQTAQAKNNSSGSSNLKCRLLNKVNTFRQQNGLSCLRRNAQLQNAAQSYAHWFSRNIVNKSTPNFGHQSDGRTPTKRALAAGYKPRRNKVKKIVTHYRRADGTLVKKTVRKITSYKFVGENILYFEGRDICKPGKFINSSYKGWKNSKVHRLNMLGRGWNATGIGLAWNSKTKRCFGVQLFGTANGSAGPCQLECR